MALLLEKKKYRMYITLIWQTIFNGISIIDKENFDR